mgnify:CR=1 FL=1
MPKALLIAEKPSLLLVIEKVYKKMNMPLQIEPKMEKVGFKFVTDDARAL